MDLFNRVNPIRAKLVTELKELDKYPYCGHSVVMGKKKNSWQDAEYILGFFNEKTSTARRQYQLFVKKGIPQGKRPELLGGGLIRSVGGWSADS